MDFDFHLHIQENSREAQVIKQVAMTEHISPELAATRLLAAGARVHGKKTPTQEMWGAFSSPENLALLDSIVEESYALRLADQPRDFGV